MIFRNNATNESEFDLFLEEVSAAPFTISRRTAV